MPIIVAQLIRQMSAIGRFKDFGNSGERLRSSWQPGIRCSSSR